MAVGQVGVGLFLHFDLHGCVGDVHRPLHLLEGELVGGKADGTLGVRPSAQLVLVDCDKEVLANVKLGVVDQERPLNVSETQVKQILLLRYLHDLTPFSFFI